MCLPIVKFTEFILCIFIVVDFTIFISVNKKFETLQTAPFISRPHMNPTQKCLDLVKLEVNVVQG